MKKIVALALVLTIVGCMFVSCEDVTSTLEKADKALTEAPYTVTMSMDFECDDETINAVFEALKMEIPITVDGENMSMDMSTEIMSISIGTKMTVVDKVLYSYTSAAGQEVKMKCTLNDEQLKDFVADNTAEMPVDYVNFGSLTMEEKDGKQLITCADITTEGLTALNDLMAESFKALGAEAAVGDLSYIITLSDGKYESMAMVCTYSVTIEGETFTTTMSMNARFDYKDIAPITAPADADDYQSVDYSDITG